MKQNKFIIGLLFLSWSYILFLSYVIATKEAEIDKLKEVPYIYKKVDTLYTKCEHPISSMTVTNQFTVSTKNKVIYYIDSLDNLIVKDCELFKKENEHDIKHKGKTIYRCGGEK